MSERVSINVARLKKAGDKFEVVIDPDKALAFKQGKLLDIKEALRDIHVYSDAQKGLKPTEEELKAAFGTKEESEIAKQIIVKGELQLTTEQRAGFREQKKAQLVQLISTYGVDPRTKAPHPPNRIESALEEGKVRIDDTKSAQEQVQDVIKQLAPILPIRIETKTLKITIPAQYAAKTYGAIKNLSTIKKEAWLQDGSWSAEIEIPGGLETDFYDQINNMTHGEAMIQRLEQELKGERNE